MSVSMKIRLDGHITPEVLLNWLYKNAKSACMADTSKINMRLEPYVDTKTCYNDDGSDLYMETTTFYYTLPEQFSTRLFMQYFNYNNYENLDYYYELGLEDMVRAETTTLIVSRPTDMDKEIGIKLVSDFGGWIDYNDCDNEPYVRVDKNTDFNPNVRHVTLEEVYEKFGEVVIIDKKRG